MKNNSSFTTSTSSDYMYNDIANITKIDVNNNIKYCKIDKGLY